MRVILKPQLVALVPDSEEERAELTAWLAMRNDHAFHLHPDASEKGAAFLDMGPRLDACREPINIVSGQGEERRQPIGNLAHTPFRLHERDYASVEGFWQGLKFSDAADRLRIAALWGRDAKTAGDAASESDSFLYEGRRHRTGTHDHWTLMFEACEAKFQQNAEARAALLATGDRPLTHRTRRDSRTIPGALMADIWMRIRRRLHQADDRNA